MLLDYVSEIKDITKEFDIKLNKKLEIDSLIDLSIKLIDLENEDTEKSMLELKIILRLMIFKAKSPNRSITLKHTKEKHIRII